MKFQNVLPIYKYVIIIINFYTYIYKSFLNASLRKYNLDRLVIFQHWNIPRGFDKTNDKT